MSNIVEEFLYSAMEDYKIDILIDKGPNARSIELGLNRFTLIGATTRAGLLTSPLRSRFGIKMNLDYYNKDILYKIIQRSASILNVEVEKEASKEIASRSRGTPRIVNYLLKRVRDFAQVKGDGIVNMDITKIALDALNIDKAGLDDMDNRILKTIMEKYNGGPVGLNTLSSAIGEDAGTIEEVFEPFLVKEGFIDRTPRGRVATKMAYEHMGIMRKGDEYSLF
jgi:Holliday junction DNA helicase RuvB